MILARNRLDSEANEVLVHIPFGKSYLSNPTTFVDQSAQKGNDCWYYVLNFLRTRYGKKFPIDKKERNFELLVSQVRKDINALFKYEYLGIIFKKNKNLNRGFFENVYNKRGDLFHLNKCKFSSQNWNVIVQTMMELLNDPDFSEVNLAEYIANKKWIIYENFFKKQGYEIKTKIKEHLKTYYPSMLNLSESKKMELIPLLQTMVCFEAAKGYGLTFADFNPKNDISNLIEEIRLYGPLFLDGDFQHALQYMTDEELDKRSVYLVEFDDVENNLDAHAILIIGASKTDQGEYVYYIDPNDPQKVTGPNIVNKIPYEDLISRICNLHVDDSKLSKSGGAPPYGFRANPKLSFMDKYGSVGGLFALGAVLVSGALIYKNLPQLR